MAGQQFRVRVAGSDVAFDCAADDTVLRAAQRAGIAFPYECNVGSCANCKFELVEGEVAMRWAQAPAWTERDRQRKRYLGCQAEPRTDCTIKLRLEPRCAPPHLPRHVGAVLQARRDLTHDLHEFSFRLDEPVRFEPGQYALAYLPGVTGPRAWSMSNVVGDDPESGRVWEFQVRRVPNGQGSAALFDALPIGARVEIDGPYGMAWLRREAPRDIVCIAGGSGLAPMLSIARGALAEPRLDGRALHFFYGARTPADVCGEDLLRALPGAAERIRYVAAVSNPSAPDAVDAWAGPIGFVHDEVRQRIGAHLAGMEVYFAGPPAMATAVQRMLVDAGVPTEQTHFDAFY
ncbi:MAG: 2Fe-2S iron-sulfur cluster-binding protein [Burkholderiaceae bacterium]